jgi:hypothetical protein
MKKDITFLFCFVDDFVQELEDEMRNIQISDARKQPRQATRVPGLSQRNHDNYIDISGISLSKFQIFLPILSSIV